MLFTQFSFQFHFFQTNSGNNVPPLPPPPLHTHTHTLFCWGEASNQIFKKGLDRISILEGIAGREGGGGGVIKYFRF